MQGTNMKIPPNGKRKIIFKRAVGEGYVSFQEGTSKSMPLSIPKSIFFFTNQRTKKKKTTLETDHAAFEATHENCVPK